jgi:Trk-type K+ transport system membrane component
MSYYQNLTLIQFVVLLLMFVVALLFSVLVILMKNKKDEEELQERYFNDNPFVPLTDEEVIGLRKHLQNVEDLKKNI